MKTLVHIPYSVDSGIKITVINNSVHALLETYESIGNIELPLTVDFGNPDQFHWVALQYNGSKMTGLVCLSKALKQ